MTSPAHRRQLAQRHDVEDAWPVVCEPFVQWVLEDRFSAGRPAWEKVGVQFTDDVTPYEEMKIGLLNGSHLALTYLGFLRGYRFVHETLGDPLLRRYVRAFMDRDVAPLLAPVPGIDLERYKDSLVERFANRAIADQLERVCSDGSSKFPKFIVPTANRLIAAGRPLERVALVVAAQAMGCERRHIICNVLLPEARPGIVGGFTITLVTMINSSAMAGAIGAGGLGDLAYRYGYQRFDTQVMLTVIIVLVLLVTLIQFGGDRLARLLNKRL
ncbi:ABC transporter permease subunit [Pseudomonas aeruginosa]